MSHGFVTSATIDGRKMKFSVGVYGFEANEYVEIAGSATQSGGAFASIYEIAEVPAAGDPSIDVTIEPRSTNQFKEGEDITVVIRVAKVWVTVLGGLEPGKGAATIPVDGTTWNHVKVVSPLNGESWSPEDGLTKQV